MEYREYGEKSTDIGRVMGDLNNTHISIIPGRNQLWLCAKIRA
jgi:hypothetical protein